MIHGMSERHDQSGDSRGLAEPKRHVRFGTFELDLRAGELRKSGVLVKLQHQPFQLLQILLESHGKVVSREELRQRLWPAGVHVDFDRSLSKAILKLRDALRDDASSPRFIETLPRVGYRFIAQIETPDGQSKAAVTAPAGGASESAASAAGERQIRSSRRGWWPGAAIVLLAAVLPILLRVGWIELQKRLKGQSTHITSLAVLPFENLSGDSAQEYLADGFTADLTASLARIGAIRVTSRTSAIRFKSAKKPLAEIARELNVAGVVEGTVVRMGTKLRVTVRVVEASTDKSLWAGTFEREQRDLMALQSEVAKDIAREIQITLSPRERMQIEHSRPVDPDVYQLYVRGRFFWEKRTEADLRKAIDYFRRAIDLDPTYAPAWAGIAHAYAPLLVQGFASQEEGAKPLRAAAVRAQELDDSLPEAHLALAAAATQVWDWPGAEREHLRAIELNPNYSIAHLWYGYSLEAAGRFSEDLRERQRAYEIDPLNVVIGVALAQALAFSGEKERAKAQYLKTLELFPDSPFVHEELGVFFEGEGQYGLAIQEFKRAGPAHALAHAYAVSGKRSEAMQILDKMKEASTQHYLAPFKFAIVYAGLGEKERALDWLERAYQVTDHQLLRVKVDPRLNPLHSEPRFKDLLRRLNFPL